MKDREFLILAQKISDGVATDKEIALYNDIINELTAIELEWDTEGMGDRNIIKDELSSRIQNKLQEPKKLRNYKKSYRIVSAAATILIALSVSLYLYLKSEKVDESAPLVTGVIADDVQPGGNKAVLTLSDGSRIVLDSIDAGEVVNYNGTKIIKTADGQLVCQSVNLDKNDISLVNTYNTIETPLGGQYQVILPDGTKVWLNAASSIKYPVVFHGKERKVELTGEAYFEVAKNKEKPFKVKVKDTFIEVLGTHFNVMAYGGERTVETTLLEGKVNVIKGSSNFVLSPGQQARTGGREPIQILSVVETEEIIAWKNGLFHFNNTALQDVMKQLERWYSVEVDEDRMPKRKFNGVVPRDVPLSQVVKMMEVTSGLKFKIENIASSGVSSGRRLSMAE